MVKAASLFTSKPCDDRGSGDRGPPSWNREVGLRGLHECLLNEFRELTVSDPALQRDANHGPTEHDNRCFESRSAGVGHSAWFRYACETSGFEELGLRTVSKDGKQSVSVFELWENPQLGRPNFCMTSSQQGFTADTREPEACLACNYTQVHAGGQDA